MTSISMKGLGEMSLRAFIASNTGVSGMRARTKAPTPTSTMLTRKGMRQPQDRNDASGIRAHQGEHARRGHEAKREAHLDRELP